MLPNLKLALISLSIIILSACSGVDSDSSDTGINVSTQNSEGTTITTVSSDSTVTVLATLTDSLGVALEGETIEFSSTSGTLSASSRLTDSNGEAQVILSFADGDVGVITITASAIIDEETVTTTTNIDVTEVSINDEEGIESFDFGSLNDSVFDSGIIYADDALLVSGTTTISAGASFGVSVTIVDQDSNPITSTPFEVTFTSTCVTAGKATIDETVFSIQGVASATYQDISCAGAEGNEDNIVASVTIDSTQYLASRNILLQPEALGSIEFVSASPESIVLKGVGGQGNQESSVLTFLVKGELGNAQSQKEVSFELSTQVGGISLIADSGTTNSEGLVTATVISGSAPTAVRVTATVTDDNNTSISTQSDVLSVNTGLPDQNSFTVSLSEFNPEARHYSGQEVTVTAYLADSFNNPVPDGTTVNFTTEGGAIEPSCTTESGNCSVIWNSQAPYPNDHRVTILATAVGHEYFVDVDGNNYYNDADGSATSVSNVESGLSSITPLSTGFVDMSETWRDDNENNSYDVGEQFIDDDNNGTFTVADGLFNGPQCQASSCSDSSLITLRKSTVLIMSGSDAYFIVSNTSTNEVYYSDFDSSLDDQNLTTVPADTELSIVMSDSALQTLPNGTNVFISTDGIMPDGSETPTYSINNRKGSVNSNNGLTHSFTTDGDTSTATTVSILVVTPIGQTRSIQWNIN